MAFLIIACTVAANFTHKALITITAKWQQFGNYTLVLLKLFQYLFCDYLARQMWTGVCCSVCTVPNLSYLHIQSGSESCQWVAQHRPTRRSADWDNEWPCSLAALPYQCTPTHHTLTNLNTIKFLMFLSNDVIYWWFSQTSY